MANFEVKKGVWGHKVLYNCLACGVALTSSLNKAGSNDTCPDCSRPHVIPGYVEKQNIELAASEKQRQKLNEAEQRREAAEAVAKQVLNPHSDPTSNILVTTGDIKQDYEILGPIYFQVSNKGIFSSDFARLRKQYLAEISDLKRRCQVTGEKPDWGFLIGEWSVGQSEFDQAFFIAVQELKKRAAILGADAIIGMRQDIDLDTTGWQFFYLQMYGTAIRLI